MRYAGNFHQEWGYLAPAPSFIRTARVVLVAVAVGATAGAGVVFSLVGREDTETSVAARTLARPAEAASAQLNVLPPAPAALGAQDHTPRSLAAHAPRAGAADSESKPSSTTMAPAGIAALAEVPAVTEDASPHPATSPSAAVPSPVAAPARLGVSSPAASAPSAAAGAPAKAAVSPAATGAPAVEGAPAQQKVVAAKKRIAPRFASRAGSSRIAPGEYYMSADNYENRGRGGYYRANGWNGGYSQSGGRFQSW
jgi:hypothetical protein